MSKKNKVSFFITLTGDVAAMRQMLTGILGEYAQMFPAPSTVRTKQFCYMCTNPEQTIGVVTDTYSEDGVTVGIKLAGYVTGSGMVAFIRRVGQNYFATIVGGYSQLIVIARYTGATPPKVLKPGTVPGFYAGEEKEVLQP